MRWAILFACLFPQVFTNHKGKQRKRYPHALMMTPYEKFKSLPETKNHLPKIIKCGVTFEILDALAYQQSDNDAAEQHLFNLIYE